MLEHVKAIDFLQALYGKCTHGDIVFVGHTRNYVTGHFPVSDIAAAADHIASQKRSPELFIKVNVMDHAKTLADNGPTGIGGVEQVAAIVSFHLDVDAKSKNGAKYTDQDALLDALDAMPLKPSNIILTDGPDGGLHVYWLLDEPHYITDEADRQRCQEMAQRWLEELRIQVKAIDENATVDGTADLCRLLRPIGSVRPKTGNVVSAMKWNPEVRYSLEQFALPPLANSQSYDWSGPAGESPRREGEGIIERYLDAIGHNSVEAILFEQGYQYFNGSDRFLIRPGSGSGAPTGEIHVSKDGRRGFTVKSGAADPLSNINNKGANGNWYCVPALWLSFKYGVDAKRNKDVWFRGAVECHQFFEPTVKHDSSASMESVNGKPINDPQPGPQPEQPKAESTESPVTHCAANVLDDYMARLKSGKLPQLLRQYSALSGIEVGPEMITVLAAYPGKGKTALTSQIMFDAMELDPELRAVVANAETGFDVLIRRQLARITRVSSRDIRFGNLDQYAIEQLNDAADELRPKLARVEVLAKPFKLAQLMRLSSSKPGLLIVDYLQKFIPHEAKDPRIGVNMVMDGLRELASVGWAVIAISATNRPGKDTSAKLSMNSLRESSEIEFQADSIYLLNDDGAVDDAKQWIRNVTLDHVKNRHDKPESKSLVFNQPRMEFTARQTEHESQFANDFPPPEPAKQTRRNAFGGCK